MSESGAPTDDPLTDPLAATLASSGTDSLEERRLRANVKGALFGDSEHAPVRLGRYRLLAKLGEGGMGVVYRAHDDELDRDVAIKLLRPDGGGSAKRLLREARSMARLSHPHIATVFDVGTHGEAIYIAMEYVEGQSLRHWLETPRTWEQIRDVMLQAARGLAAAHAADVVHRDFKPDNMIVGTDGRVRVLDFGLAKLSRTELGPSTDPVLTEAGRMLGTPRYMAPEQLRARTAGPAADQFALCVTFYEAAYGSPPFEGEVFAEVAASVLAGKPKPPPDDAIPPAGLWPILERGLAFDVDDRHPDLTSLIAAIEALDNLPADARVISRPALRDARERVRSQLGTAFAQSLIDADELDERLERLEDAHSPDTVDALVADLQPTSAPASPPAPSPVVTEAALVPVADGGGSNLPAIPEPATSSNVTAIFGGTSRNGPWVPARINHVRALFGGVDLDFREVELPPGETIVDLQVFCGGVDIVVPPGVRVAVEATTILGGVDSGQTERLPPDAPVLKIIGTVIFGGVDVRERLSGEGAFGAWRRRRRARKALHRDKRRALPPAD